MAADDLEGYVPEVSLGFFKSSVLPSLSEGKIAKFDEAVTSLVDAEQNRWKKFPVDPKDIEEHKNRTFVPFPSLVNQIVIALIPALGCHKEEVVFEVEARPNETLDSRNSLHANSQVDTFVALRKRKGMRTCLCKEKKPATDNPATKPAFPAGADDNSSQPPSNVSRNATDTIFVCEFKKDTDPKQILDNQDKVMHAARHAFQFDWIGDRVHLVHFLASLAFASEVDLSFDASVERILFKVPLKGVEDVATKDNIAYNISCGGTWYRVLRRLSDHKATRILGRASRVWEVQEVRDKDGHPVLVGDTFAVKDVWINENSPSEGEILDDIISKMNKVHPIDGLDLASETIEKLVAEHFEVDEVVKIGDPASLQDDTTATILRGFGLPTEANALRMTMDSIVVHNSHSATTIQSSLSPPPYKSPGSVSDQIHSNSKMANPSLTEDKLPLKTRALSAKRHRRILYTDYGRPLDHDDVTLRHELYFKALAKAVAGLRLIFSAGYVHRDFSTGNLIYFQDGSCKISDFEYAKPCSLTQGPEAETGAIGEG